MSSHAAGLPRQRWMMGLLIAAYTLNFVDRTIIASIGRYEYSVIPIQAFSNYHFIVDGQRAFDPYVGLALVYSMVNASWNGAGSAGATSEGSGTTIAGQAGLRYFLSPTLAVQGQVGFGYGTLGLGASWRF